MVLVPLSGAFPALISMRIIDIKIKDIPLAMLQKARREGLTFASNTQLLGLFDGNELIGFTGLLWYINKVVFKNHYVISGRRRQGLFREMLNFSIGLAISQGIFKGEATCTTLSLSEYLRRGFRIIKQYRNGMVKVCHENLRKAKCI